jgi:hypothetical protein
MANRVRNGAVAANKLQLTTQVPMQLGYLTSGAPRTLHLGPETTLRVRKCHAADPVAAPNDLNA